MKKLIASFNNQFYEFDSLPELISIIFGNEYQNLSEKEKFIKRYEIAFPISKLLNIPIAHTKLGTIGEFYKILTKEVDIKNSFVIDSEITFILSLCKFEKILLLENINSNIFINKLEDLNTKDNYIILNSFCDVLLTKFCEVK